MTPHGHAQPGFNSDISALASYAQDCVGRYVVDDAVHCKYAHRDMETGAGLAQARARTIYKQVQMWHRHQFTIQVTFACPNGAGGHSAARAAGCQAARRLLVVAGRETVAVTQSSLADACDCVADLACHLACHVHEQGVQSAVGSRIAVFESGLGTRMHTTHETFAPAIGQMCN